MTTRLNLHFALLGVLLSTPLTGMAQIAPGQSFAGSPGPVGIESNTAAGAYGASDSKLYADGTRAINEGRWPDAEAIFTNVASQHSEHSDGALYWKAYAENKQGQTKPALDTCAALGRDYPGSSWIQECSALEIEIREKSGAPVEPKAGDDDDLKLLALNSLMKKHEAQALAQIQEVLNSSDSSEKLKKEALFILGQHYSNTTYAQIVRIRYVEGDVRITRGEENEKPAGATWEKAVADLPLETGFSLVTGAGRAEIEFEDASMLYLGENSVLTLNDLHTTAGVPYSELGLLAGTVSVNLHPYIPGELFILKTPTDDLSLKYPDVTEARVSSYLDGMAVTPNAGTVLRLPGITLVNGQTLYFRDGHLIDSAGSGDAGAFAEWDTWVADRIAQRTAAMAAVMKASGLKEPIPGLADMKGQGTFFACAPYGTCWEPTAAEGQQAGDKSSEARPSSGGAFEQRAHIVLADFIKLPRSTGLRAMQMATPALATHPYLEDELFLPCLPISVRDRLVTNSLTVVHPWDWTLCHAGSWVPHRSPLGNHYVWVVGHHRHHLPPGHWVKSGSTVAFVPLHPYDVKSRPPINQKQEVFAVSDKNGFSVERIKLDPESKIELLNSPPREFRTVYLAPLARADAPHMEAHALGDAFAGRKSTAKTEGISLSFDAKSQSFMMPKQVMHLATVSVPITNHDGSLQARGGSFAGGHGGFDGRGGFIGGGGSSGGGAHGGGGSSGGGSHGGGGSSGGGSSGGAHGSGGSSGGGGHK